MRIAYLGPAGTFTEDALGEATGAGEFEPLRTATIHDAILAVEAGEAERALVPVRELDRGLGPRHPRHPRLRRRRGDDRRRARLPRPRPPDRPRGSRARRRSRRCSPTRSRWPSAHASCARRCPASNCAASAAPPPLSAWSPSPSAPGPPSAPALPPSSTAARSCARGWRTRPATSPGSSGSPPPEPSPTGDGPWKTSLVFSELGEDHPGALVDALGEFSSRSINLTRIESRPMRQGLGRYMFFCDLEGAETDPVVADALAQLCSKAGSVRILGSYPVG